MVKANYKFKVFLYISAWFIIWGSIASLIDLPFLKNDIYSEGELGQYLTFSLTAMISIICAKNIFSKINSSESTKDTENISIFNNQESKWIDNSGEEVNDVFGFNASAELVNGRAAMVGFLMLILTELVFHGRPVTSAIFGIN